MDARNPARIRNLVAADVDAVVAFAWDAGWNQTAADWARMITLEPEGCFCVDVDGRLAATTTLICYGTELAWLGMVLTHRDHQRRGYARALCEAALALADRRGVACVKLDATDQGRPLYLQLGFVDEQPVERWLRPGLAESPIGDMPSAAFDAVLDLRAFGADRRKFLESMGYAQQRPGHRAHYLGPVVGEAQAALIPEIVGAIERPCFWDLLPSNQKGVSLARDLGFEPVRRLTRMRRGTPIRTVDALVYAIAGFEAG